MRCLSPMVVTTFIDEKSKLKLLNTTINWICNHIDVQLTQNDPFQTRQYFASATFLQFRTAMQAAQMRGDIFQKKDNANTAIKLWNFGLQFTNGEGHHLSNEVKLLRQIIQYINEHLDDVWTKEGEDFKLYYTSRDQYYRNYQHVTTKPHAPREPAPPAAEPTEPAPRDITTLLHKLRDLLDEIYNDAARHA